MKTNLLLLSIISTIFIACGGGNSEQTQNIKDNQNQTNTQKPEKEQVSDKNTENETIKETNSNNEEESKTNDEQIDTQKSEKEEVSDKNTENETTNETTANDKSEEQISQPLKQDKTTFDMNNYLYNYKALSSGKIVVTYNKNYNYLDEKLNYNDRKAIIYKKSEIDNSVIEEYNNMPNLYLKEKVLKYMESSTEKSSFKIGDNIEYTDGFDGSKKIYKRVLSIGEVFFKEIDKVNGGNYVCNLSKHYDTINVQTTINTILKQEYLKNVDKTYNDVVEILCANDTTDERGNIFFAKDNGLVFRVITETKTGKKDKYFSYEISQKIFEN